MEGSASIVSSEVRRHKTTCVQTFQDPLNMLEKFRFTLDKSLALVVNGVTECFTLGISCVMTIIDHAHANVFQELYLPMKQSVIIGRQLGTLLSGNEFQLFRNASTRCRSRDMTLSVCVDAGEVDVVVGSTG
jgi:hypothetical protein